MPLGRTVQLRLFWESRQQRMISLSSPHEILFGSGEQAHIRVPDNTVSGVHCVLRVGADGQVVIQDLNSRNGTRLNGRRFIGSVRLFSGDLVQFGYITLLFMVVSQHHRELSAHAS